MKKLFVQVYGCQMNVRDAEEVIGLLLEEGYTLTEDQGQADVILYNTCSVREHAEDRVWSNVGALREMKARRPELVIGVMGCMAKAQSAKIFKRMPHVDFISGPAQIYEVPELIEAVYESRRAGNRLSGVDGGCDSVAVAGPIAAIRQKRRAEFKTIPYHASPVSALITIMEGCDKVCSYCIIPYTRGPEVSRPPEQVLREVQELVGRGYKEVMLLGQNVNSYGRRFPNEATGQGKGQRRGTFPELLRQVDAIAGIERIRFITSHPWDAVEGLFEAMRDLPHVCEHLHLPVQSGSDRILEKMRRGYTIGEYLDKIQLLRRMVPQVSVTTDIIVGFPGETEEDFEGTVRLMEEAQFDGAFLFSYSPRPFAAASRWLDDVPRKLKEERLQRVLKLQERITRSRDERQLGQVVEVLVEEPRLGRTRQNRKVYFEEEAGKVGDLVPVQVKSVRGQSLVGSCIARTAAVLFLGAMLLISPAWAADEVGSLQAAYLRGEYERVLRSAKDLQDRGESPSDGFLYLQGVSALKLGDLPASRAALTRLLESYPNSRWLPQAWLGLGDGWEAAGEHEEALRIYGRYLQQDRDGSLAPQALLRIGMIQRELGRWDEARVSLQEVVSRWAGTSEAAQAGELLRSSEFYFCVQVGAFVTQANAEKLAAELRRRGHAASVTRAAMHGRIYHRVRVGQFSTRDEAEREAAALQQDGFPAKVIP